MVLNALHGDSLPVYGDGKQVRNWLYVEDFCRGIHTVLTKGKAGEAYNVGGPDECENIEVVKRVIELTGGDESLIEYVKDRPGHDRRYSLSSAKLKEELGWEAQVHFAEGLERTVQLVPRQRGLVGPDPLRRVPRVLRKAVREGARLVARAAADEARRGRPDRAGRPRRRARLHGRVLQPRAPGASSGSTSSSSSTTTRAPRKGTLRGIHFQTEPGQAKLVRCARGEILDVAVDLRRGSPTYGQWEAHVLDDVKHRQLFVPVGFGHGFAVLSDEADVAYQVSSYYDPATEAGIAWDDPDVGVDWQVAEPAAHRARQAARRSWPRSPTRCRF